MLLYVLYVLTWFSFYLPGALPVPYEKFSSAQD